MARITEKTGIGRAVRFARHYRESAEANKKGFGSTKLYQTPLPALNEYLGGGIGRPDNYEICLLYGETGIGKSTFALNLLANAIAEGKRVGLFLMEDAPDDEMNRLEHIIGTKAYRRIMALDNLRILCDEQLSENEKGWTLDNLAAEIEDWFSDPQFGVDVILLDPIQMAFDGAVTDAGQNEYNGQRIFMRTLNRIVKQYRKTVFITSHVNKGKDPGMNRILGSGALAQVASKIIEVNETEDHRNLSLFLRKTRFTKKRYEPYLVNISRLFRMEDVTGKQ